MRLKRGFGFTIVEMIIVIAIIGILLTLAFAMLSNSRQAADDDAIATESATLARGLEEYYRRGDPGHSINAGSYPSTSAFLDAKNNDYLDSWLEGVPYEITKKIVVVANNATVGNTSSVGTLAKENVLVYEPITRSGAVCANPEECVRFNLYYRTMQDNVLHTVRSGRQ